MVKRLIRRFVAWCIEKEADKCKRFSEPWFACATVASMFKGEYKYK